MIANPYRPFAVYLRPYRRQVVLGLALLLVGQAIITVLPLLLKQIVDAVRQTLDGAPVELLAGTIEREIGLFAILIALLALVQWGSSIGMRWYLSSMSRLVERDIRQAYVQRLLHLPLSFFHQHRVGDLMARAINDVEAIQRFLHHALRMTLTGLLAFALSLALMASIDWRLALYSLAPMPLMAFSTRWVSGRVRNGFRQVQEQFAGMSARIQESLAGVRVVKAYAREELEVEDFSALNEEYVERNRRLVNIRSLFFPFTALLNGVSMLVILWLGGLRVIEGTMTLGAFVAFNAYLIRLGRPMMLLGRMVDEYQRAAASLHRLEAVLLGEPVQDPGRVAAGEMRRGEIEFRRVGFAYDGGRPALEGIDLRIPAGSTLAVVGRVGSGKSTLARLIPRLIEAGQGEVLIDGRPVGQWPLAALRGAIGYVPQDSFLFSATIGENIALGSTARARGEKRVSGASAAQDGGRGEQQTGGAAIPDLAWAAEVAQLSAELAAFPHGMETLVGERGVTLSGGQKQRTALARAIIRQPQILILDDALASVDTHTEEQILSRLRGIMAERTTLIIAHRLSTVRDADRIVVLDEGHIAEAGTHDELLALGGIYADLYRRQHLAAELTEL